MIDLFKKPHKRFNPLTREWVLVSPQRLRRPWQGKVEQASKSKRPEYVPDCYLCPLNERAGGKRNPDYTSTFVFDNDFSALLPRTEPGCYEKGDLFLARAEKGICRVICYSPRHDLTMAEMSIEQIGDVVETWVQQYLDLGAKDYIHYVQIFENKGEIMGCSNPHPHGQVWATQSLPVQPEKEDRSQREFFHENSKECLLCEYLRSEMKTGERIVCRNESWLALVPFWAMWPFETMVLPARHVQDLSRLESEERRGMADILKQLTTRYDNLFRTSFPYTMGFHQAPTDGLSYPYWHLHIHFYPPLLRSATVQKFMVGFEMLGTPQRDFTAEQAADRLASLSETHFRHTGD